MPRVWLKMLLMTGCGALLGGVAGYIQQCTGGG